MGTRGFFGFVADGHETIVYSQFDSYPEGLGVDVLRYAASVTDWDEVRKSAATIVHVSDETPPTDEQIEQLSAWTNLNVGERTDRPVWYQLLRETQGEPAEVLKAGHAEHRPDWPGESLFCEWGYLLDLDGGKLEAFEGFQQAPHTTGRFHDRPGLDGYYPVRRVAQWSLDSLPTPEEFVATLEPEEGE